MLFVNALLQPHFHPFSPVYPSCLPRFPATLCGDNPLDLAPFPVTQYLDSKTGALCICLSDSELVAAVVREPLCSYGGTVDARPTCIDGLPVDTQLASPSAWADKEPITLVKHVLHLFMCVCSKESRNILRVEAQHNLLDMPDMGGALSAVRVQCNYLGF